MKCVLPYKYILRTSAVFMSLGVFNNFKLQAKNINYNPDFSSCMGPFNDLRMSIINLGILKCYTAFLFPFITQVICFFPPQCHHMFFVDFVVFPPGHGRSVTDF